METVKNLNGFTSSFKKERVGVAKTTRISECGNSTVKLKLTDSENLLSLNYQGKTLGQVDISDVNQVIFIPLPMKSGYSLIELEKISSGLKKARQMRQQQINMIESFLG